MFFFAYIGFWNTSFLIQKLLMSIDKIHDFWEFLEVNLIVIITIFYPQIFFSYTHRIILPVSSESRFSIVWNVMTMLEIAREISSVFEW